MSTARPRTLDPKLDVVFKLLFSDEQNRPLLFKGGDFARTDIRAVF